LLPRKDCVDGQYVAQLFKWVKQNLRIKCFYSTSENAVKTQIWIAVSVYVLIAIVEKRLHLEVSLYTLLQILSVSLFEKMPIQQAFSDLALQSEGLQTDNQLNLFEF
jgi:high-affinity nickel permease